MWDISAVWWAVTLTIIGQSTAQRNRPLGPPEIYIQPKYDLYFKPGETVQMPCRAEGNPQPTYEWTMNGLSYNPSGQDDRVVQLPNQGTIVINRPEDKDEGIYQCRAKNNYGVSASININLREAKLDMFPNENRLERRVFAGYSFVLPCTPPVSYPPADVYWVIKEPDGRWTAINYDKRISIDLEGKLRFANVKFDDHQDGKAYSCFAINYFMRQNAIGREFVINVEGTSEQKFPAYEYWTSPSDHFALKGKSLHIKCIFAGNPTPNVYWKKIGSVLPDRAKYLSFGQELMISNLEESDAGRYECMGLNSETKDRPNKAFNIRIESGPYWIDEPKNLERGEGETATFVCKAGGNPKPRILWYINAIPLEEVLDPNSKFNDDRLSGSKRFSKPNENTIILANLTLNDHMNIQCNATNKHTYIFGDFFLNVLAEDPKIVQPPPPFLKVAEGKSVEITCRVSGKPDPIITWFRGESLITGGRYSIMTQGNLKIDNVVLADAGEYRCSARQRGKPAILSSKCNLQIRRKTRIEQFPLSLETIATQDAKFTCSGSTDITETGNLRVYWLKDDKEVSTNDQRMSLNAYDNSLTISGTIVRDSGVYTCVVDNGLDNATADAILTVKDRPDPPTGVEWEHCKLNSADVKWIKGIENNAPVQYFLVQYNTTFNKDQWTSLLVDSQKKTANIRLSPYGNYTFRVIAVNKIGPSAPSFPSNTSKPCKTDPAVPDKNPSNVQSIGDTPNYLIVEWTPMDPSEHNGDAFEYIITVKERGTADPMDVPPEKDWRVGRTKVRVPNQIYKPYLVTVRAKNGEGESSANPVEKTLYSAEYIPKVAPLSVEVVQESISSTKATIRWTWKTNWMEEDGKIKEVQGDFKGFKMQLWRQNEKPATFRDIDVYLHELPRPTPGLTIVQSEWEITNLSPFSNIEIQMCLMNTYYVGPPSTAISFQTKAGEPGPVRNLQAVIKSPNSFQLQWDLPLEEDKNGQLTGYDIAYQHVEGLEIGSIHDREPQINDPQQRIALLGGLLPGRKYRVTIWARTMNERGEQTRGEATFIEESTTAIAAPDAPSFSVKEITQDMINVTWTPKAALGSRVVHYVEYRKKGADDWQQSAEVVLNNHKEIWKLEAGTTYQIRVVAFNGESRKESEIQEVDTVGISAARALVANYGWFIGMVLSLLAIIFIGFVLWWCHRQRSYLKYKEGAPKTVREKQTFRDTAPEFESEPRGHYNDYYKDRKRRDDGFDDVKKESYDDDYDRGRRYDNKHYGYGDDEDDDGGFRRGPRRDSYDDRYRDSYDDRYRDSYDDRHRDSYDDRKRDSYDDRKRDSYDRYDDDYDRRDDKYDPPRYDRPESYERTPSYEKRPPGDADYEEYQREPSKFDDDGFPIDTAPKTTVAGTPGSSTFV